MVVGHPLEEGILKISGLKKVVKMAVIQHISDKMKRYFFFKSEHKLTSSLALRVLLINIVCLVMPLLAYTGYTFVRDYQDTMEEIFGSLKTMRQDQITWIENESALQLNLMGLIHDLVTAEKKAGGALSDDAISEILHKFTTLENISAIAYLEPDSDGHMICINATNRLMLGRDLSTFIDFRAVFDDEQHLFIAKDPIYGYSQFVVKSFENSVSGKVEGAIVTITTLSTILRDLDTIPSIYNGYTSILSLSMEVLASDNPALVGQTIFIGEHTHHAPGNVIRLKPALDLQESYFYTYQNKRYLSVISPIKDLPLQIMLQAPEREIVEEVYVHVWKIFALLLFILVLGGMLTLLLTWRMARPFKELCDVMSSVGKGNLQTRSHHDSFGFEINVLGDIFNKTLDALALYIEQVKVERVRKELLKKELDIGREIQVAILPKSFPALSHLQVAADCRSAKEVGGDFYDCFVTEVNSVRKVVMLVADTSGKGISACLFSLGIRSAIRSFAMTTHDIQEIITKTNALFCLDTGETGMFVTVWISLFDPATHELQYTSMGHLPAYYRKKEGVLMELATSGIPMGVAPIVQLEVKSIKLEEGDLLFLYTDGITEASDKNNQMFGKERIAQRLLLSQNAAPAILMESLFRDVQYFVGAAPQYDDMTVLIARVVSPL